MIGVIGNHKVTNDEDRVFSDTVYAWIAHEWDICHRDVQDGELPIEVRRYAQGRLDALSTALDDLSVRDDTRLRGAADAYNEIIGMLNKFVMECEKNGR